MWSSCRGRDAERHGIIEYRVDNNIMVFNRSYPAYLGNKRYTIQHEITLNTLQEKTKQLKGYDTRGEYNI